MSIVGLLWLWYTNIVHFEINLWLCQINMQSPTTKSNGINLSTFSHNLFSNEILMYTKKNTVIQFILDQSVKKKSYLGINHLTCKLQQFILMFRYSNQINQMIHMNQIRSVAQSCPTLCDPMNPSTPSLPVHHQLPEFTETHVHQVSDAIQPSHPLSSPSPPAPNPSQHQSLFQ